ncbi:MAG: Rpn family recombination-promoting nuclease/putative transposase [Clostridiales bacterium]|nr:Rpn family recombination-promoting nuclease/putative transposase [Clostridiales bacterium]
MCSDCSSLEISECLFDIKVKTVSGKIINLEIQVALHSQLRERIIFYAARLITEQLNDGDPFSKLRKVISIIITNEILIKDDSKVHHKFTLYDIDAETEFSDIIEIHTLDLPKCSDEPDGTDLWEWLTFLKAGSEEELNMLAQKSPKMENPSASEAPRIVAKLPTLNQDKEARALFEAREKYRRDTVAREEDARSEGIEEGRKEGIQEGKASLVSEIALRLLHMDMPPAEIARITNLSVEEINDIRINNNRPQNQGQEARRS